ncbi:hypothetical protein ACBY01_06080 [Sphingomonas sp. ac-8]|uniref:hypothetical protein n=1 Tax=Sphingomonas sp. ac-8 TaxID=3242977 RepID=UPI003A7FD96F
MEHETIASPAAGRRHNRIAALLFCLFAALCSTWLSGINFPEQNNRWQIPVVLDFAGSAEGPHDAYARSFASFISPFWIAVRSVTDEANIQAVFVAIQLAGNALLAAAIFALIRQAGGRLWPSAFVTGFLCFCYGLWGATPLGYSELFVGYATHSQIAITLCLFALALIAARRPLLAGALLGVAANINLFLAVWGALTAGIALVALQRRIVTREQIGLSLLFLAIAAPVTLWGLSANAGGNIPTSFFHDFIAGHVYGFDYPRALAQSFALLLCAALAAHVALPGAAGQRFALLLMASIAVLAVAAALPYLTDAALLLLLHPLRFTSIPVVLAAACAGALFVQAFGERPDAPPSPMRFAAALALAGFALKLPVVSCFGFALAVPAGRRRVRAAALLLSAACTLALFLPSPTEAMSGKAALALLMLCATLTAVAALRPENAPLPLRLSAGALGSVATVPLLPASGAAILLAAAAAIGCAALPRRRTLASALAGVSILLSLSTVRNDLVALATLAAGVLLLAIAPMLLPAEMLRPLARAGLIALVPLLMAAGFAKGARDGFAPSPSAEQRNFTAAQRWARLHTPRDAPFLAVSVPDGFTLFSRRPVWWEQSQGAAVLWQPDFLPLWSERRAALAAATPPHAIVALTRREGVAYLVVKAAHAPKFGGAVPVYTNAHYAILHVRPIEPLARP